MSDQRSELPPGFASEIIWSRSGVEIHSCERVPPRDGGHSLYIYVLSFFIILYCTILSSSRSPTMVDSGRCTMEHGPWSWTVMEDVDLCYLERHELGALTYLYLTGVSR